ncbi:NmrA family transcriptional regulator [Rhodococcus sp. ABRD24]|uniref:SDR family oxidoreductase n=1 Tax=Rhodococcus sp. ABRD24 TaxID=2507582 RepID=UPI00104078A1|nr:NmrA family NAD(P)-binding protein [Rhodococcus sp. ABRD24]QBJ96359.1 NmrA family transcriptional regulator [Rhodococcus sp. ABRD24]
MNSPDTVHVAVLGSAGAQGSAIADALDAAGVPTRRISRTGNGSGTAAADLRDTGALTAALSGIDVAVLTLPLDFSSEAAHFARNVADAAAASGVQRIVFNTNTRIPDEITDAPGFETRRAARITLETGAVPVTIIEPAVYLDNLLAPGVLTHSRDGSVLRYPIPEGLPVSWLAASDLGRAVAAACLNGRGGEVVRPGRAPLTPEELAGAIEGAIGTSVRFEALDPALFEQGLAAVAGPNAAAGVASIYRWLTANPGSTVMAAPAEQPAWMPQPATASAWAADFLKPVASKG